MKIVDTAIAATGIFLAVSTFSLTAQSQTPPCLQWGMAMDVLAAHGELPVAHGLMGRQDDPLPKNVVLFVNPITGLWKLITVEDGKGCAFLSGYGWEFNMPEPGAPS